MVEFYLEELLHMVLDLHNRLDDESVCQNAGARESLEMGSLCNGRLNAGCTFDLPHLQRTKPNDICRSPVDVLHHPRVSLRPPTIDAPAADHRPNRN